MADDTILIDIEYNTDEAEKEVTSLTESIEGLMVAQSQLKDQVEKGQISDVEASKQKAKIQTQLQTEKKQRKDLIKIVQTEKGSRDKLKQTISQLIRERNALNTSTKEGARRSEELRKRINKLDKQLQKTGTTTEKAKGNIGKYGQAMNGLPGPINGVIGSMKTLAKVIFATPLGWLIGLIAGAGAALKSFFTGSAEGQERWNKTMNKAKAVMSVFKDELIKAGKGISDFAKNIRESEGGIKGWAKNLKDRAQEGFKKFGEDVKDKGLWNTLKDNASDAIDAVKGKLDELDASLQENLMRAELIASKQNELRRDEISSLTEVATLNRDIAELRAKAADRENTTAQQRLDLLDEAIDKQNEILSIEEDLAAERIRIQKLEMAQGENRLEDYEELAALEKAQIDLETTNAERRRRFQSERQTAIRQIKAEELELETLLGKELLAIDAQLDAELLENDKLLKEELLASEEAYNERILNETLAHEDEKMAIRKESINAIGQISNEAFNFITASNQNRLDTELAAIEAKRERELALAGDNAAAQDAINKKYDKEQAKREKEAGKRQKRIAIAQAIANGALAITKILAEVPKFDFGVSTAILIGAAAATTALQVATISKQKFDRGGRVPLAKRGANFGTFDGPSHSGGGIDLYTGSGQHVANVEGKENFYVINKDASAYINSLSDINQRIGGGVPLSSKRARMQEGGQADVQQESPNINDMTEKIIKNFPPIVVQTVDIKTGLQEREEVIDVSVV